MCQMLCVCGHRHPPPRGRESCGDMLTSVPFKTVWPSGLRRWLQAPVRKGVGLNPTAVISELQVPDIQYARATGSTRLCSSAAPSLSETAPPPSPPESGPHMWLQILSKRLQRQPWPLPRLIFPKNRAPPSTHPGGRTHNRQFPATGKVLMSRSKLLAAGEYWYAGPSCSGARGWGRVAAAAFYSQMLYRLSYSRVACSRKVRQNWMQSWGMRGKHTSGWADTQPAAPRSGQGFDVP